MNITVISFIVIIVLLFSILIYLLNVNQNINKKVNKDVKRDYKRVSSDLIVIDLNTVNFPKNIENMNFDSLYKACKVVFDSFKALDYANKFAGTLEKTEWHSWQVSIILRYLKTNNKFFIPNNIKVFHDVISDLSKTELDQEIQRIYRKYVDNVNIYRSRDELSKDIMWTARDVSIIFYKIIH